MDDPSIAAWLAEADGEAPADGESPLVRLPTAMRQEFKDPLGPIYTDPASLVADAALPVIAVGDIVTYHLLQAGHQPAVAVVDGKTKRETVDASIWAAIDGFDSHHRVRNPQGTLSVALVETLGETVEQAAAAPDTSRIVLVKGEEDLAALPVLVTAPLGASLVYGQPEEGMVLTTVDERQRADALDRLERMDGDNERLHRHLGLR